MVSYKDIILAIEKFLDIDSTSYTKQYNILFTEIKNSFINKNYEFQDKLVIDESDLSLTTITGLMSNKLANLIIDDNEERISLALIDYAGLDKHELLKNISVLSLLSLQDNENVKANLGEIKKQYPLRENVATKLLLFILLFYDMGLYRQVAILSTILVEGSFNDIDM